jgi:hypothetical protein
VSKPSESPLCRFPLLIVLPSCQRTGDIFLLTLFRAAGKKDYEQVAIFAEVNSVAGAKINPELISASSHALGVRKIALLNARQCCRDFGYRFSV